MARLRKIKEGKKVQIASYHIVKKDRQGSKSYTRHLSFSRRGNGYIPSGSANLNGDPRTAALARLVRDVDTEDGSEEEQDNLSIPVSTYHFYFSTFFPLFWVEIQGITHVDDDTSHKHLDQSRVPVNPRAISIRDPHVDESVPERVAVGVAMEVVVEETSGRNVEDKDDEVESSGNKL